MLHSKSLSRYCKDAGVFRIGSKSKHTSWTKFNKENKYLFGDLLKKLNEQEDKVNNKHSVINNSILTCTEERKCSLHGGKNDILQLCQSDNEFVNHTLSKLEIFREPLLTYFAEPNYVRSNHNVNLTYADDQLIACSSGVEDVLKLQSVFSPIINRTKVKVKGSRSVDSLFRYHSLESFNGLFELGYKNSSLFPNGKKLFRDRTVLRTFYTSSSNFESWIKGRSYNNNRTQFLRKYKKLTELKKNDLCNGSLNLLGSAQRNELYVKRRATCADVISDFHSGVSPIRNKVPIHSKYKIYNSLTNHTGRRLSLNENNKIIFGYKPNFIYREKSRKPKLKQCNLLTDKLLPKSTEESSSKSTGFGQKKLQCITSSATFTDRIKSQSTCPYRELKKVNPTKQYLKYSHKIRETKFDKYKFYNGKSVSNNYVGFCYRRNPINSKVENKNLHTIHSSIRSLNPSTSTRTNYLRSSKSVLTPYEIVDNSRFPSPEKFYKNDKMVQSKVKLYTGFIDKHKPKILNRPNLTRLSKRNIDNMLLKRINSKTNKGLYKSYTKSKEGESAWNSFEYPLNVDRNVLGTSDSVNRNGWLLDIENPVTVDQLPAKTFRGMLNYNYMRKKADPKVTFVFKNHPSSKTTSEASTSIRGSRSVSVIAGELSDPLFSPIKHFTIKSSTHELKSPTISTLDMKSNPIFTVANISSRNRLNPSKGSEASLRKGGTNNSIKRNHFDTKINKSSNVLKSVKCYNYLKQSIPLTDVRHSLSNVSVSVLNQKPKRDSVPVSKVHPISMGNLGRSRVTATLNESGMSSNRCEWYRGRTKRTSESSVSDVIINVLGVSKGMVKCNKSRADSRTMEKSGSNACFKLEHKDSGSFSYKAGKSQNMFKVLKDIYSSKKELQPRVVYSVISSKRVSMKQNMNPVSTEVQRVPTSNSIGNQLSKVDSDAIGVLLPPKNYVNGGYKRKSGNILRASVSVSNAYKRNSKEDSTESTSGMSRKVPKIRYHINRKEPGFGESSTDMSYTNEPQLMAVKGRLDLTVDKDHNKRTESGLSSSKTWQSAMKKSRESAHIKIPKDYKNIYKDISTKLPNTYKTHRTPKPIVKVKSEDARLGFREVKKKASESSCGIPSPVKSAVAVARPTLCATDNKQKSTTNPALDKITEMATSFLYSYKEPKKDNYECSVVPKKDHNSENSCNNKKPTDNYHCQESLSTIDSDRFKKPVDSKDVSLTTNTERQPHFHIQNQQPGVKVQDCTTDMKTALVSNKLQLESCEMNRFKGYPDKNTLKTKTEIDTGPNTGSKDHMCSKLKDNKMNFCKTEFQLNSTSDGKDTRVTDRISYCYNIKDVSWPEKHSMSLNRNVLSDTSTPYLKGTNHHHRTNNKYDSVLSPCSKESMNVGTAFTLQKPIPPLNVDYKTVFRNRSSLPDFTEEVDFIDNDLKNGGLEKSIHKGTVIGNYVTKSGKDTVGNVKGRAGGSGGIITFETPHSISKFVAVVNSKNTDRLCTSNGDQIGSSTLESRSAGTKRSNEIVTAVKRPSRELKLENVKTVEQFNSQSVKECANPSRFDVKKHGDKCVLSFEKKTDKDKIVNFQVCNKTTSGEALAEFNGRNNLYTKNLKSKPKVYNEMDSSMKKHDNEHVQDPSCNAAMKCKANSTDTMNNKRGTMAYNEYNSKSIINEKNLLRDVRDIDRNTKSLIEESNKSLVEMEVSSYGVKRPILRKVKNNTIITDMLACSTLEQPLRGKDGIKCLINQKLISSTNSCNKRCEMLSDNKNKDYHPSRLRYSVANEGEGGFSQSYNISTSKVSMVDSMEHKHGFESIKSRQHSDICSQWPWNDVSNKNIDKLIAKKNINPDVSLYKSPLKTDTFKTYKTKSTDIFIKKDHIDHTSKDRSSTFPVVNNSKDVTKKLDLLISRMLKWSTCQKRIPSNVYMNSEVDSDTQANGDDRKNRCSTTGSVNEVSHVNTIKGENCKELPPVVNSHVSETRNKFSDDRMSNREKSSKSSPLIVIDRPIKNKYSDAEMCLDLNKTCNTIKMSKFYNSTNNFAKYENELKLAHCENKWPKTVTKLQNKQACCIEGSERKRDIGVTKGGNVVYYNSLLGCDSLTADSRSCKPKLIEKQLLNEDSTDNLNDRVILKSRNTKELSTGFDETNFNVPRKTQLSANSLNHHFSGKFSCALKEDGIDTGKNDSSRIEVPKNGSAYELKDSKKFGDSTPFGFYSGQFPKNSYGDYVKSEKKMLFKVKGDSNVRSSCVNSIMEKVRKIERSLKNSVAEKQGARLSVSNIINNYEKLVKSPAQTVRPFEKEMFAQGDSSIYTSASEEAESEQHALPDPAKTEHHDKGVHLFDSSEAIDSSTKFAAEVGKKNIPSKADECVQSTQNVSSLGTRLFETMETARHDVNTNANSSSVNSLPDPKADTFVEPKYTSSADDNTCGIYRNSLVASDLSKDGLSKMDNLLLYCSSGNEMHETSGVEVSNSSENEVLHSGLNDKRAVKPANNLCRKVNLYSGFIRNHKNLNSVKIGSRKKNVNVKEYSTIYCKETSEPHFCRLPLPGDDKTKKDTESIQKVDFNCKEDEAARVNVPFQWHKGKEKQKTVDGRNFLNCVKKHRNVSISKRLETWSRRLTNAVSCIAEDNLSKDLCNMVKLCEINTDVTLVSHSLFNKLEKFVVKQCKYDKERYRHIKKSPSSPDTSIREKSLNETADYVIMSKADPQNTVVDCIGQKISSDKLLHALVQDNQNGLVRSYEQYSSENQKNIPVFHMKTTASSSDVNHLMKPDLGQQRVTMDANKLASDLNLPQKSFKITVIKDSECPTTTVVVNVIDKIKNLIKCPKRREPCFEFANSIVQPKRSITDCVYFSEGFVQRSDFFKCASKVMAECTLEQTAQLPADGKDFVNCHSCMPKRQTRKYPDPLSILNPSTSNDKNDVFQAEENANVLKESSPLKPNNVKSEGKLLRKSKCEKPLNADKTGNKSKEFTGNATMKNLTELKDKCNRELKKAGNNFALFSKLTTHLNPDMLTQIKEVQHFPLLNKNRLNLSYALGDQGVIHINYSTIFNNNELREIPSVTRILNATMSEKARTALEKWKKQMIEKHGLEGFESLNRAKLQQGSNFHDCLKQRLLGFSLEDLETKQETLSKLLQSVKLVLKNLSSVSVIESHVIHSQLPYRGIIDCVAKYNGKPAVIEWKHSDKKRRYLQWTYDAPIQMSAYLGALNYDENYKIPVDSGMVIVAYTDGSPADVFWLSQDLCQRYWKIWLSRLHQFLSTHTNA